MAKILNDLHWKGFMIDTARHMPSIDYLYRSVDRLSELGLNKLHLHLSDDQGFRVEIMRYPKLNTIGSFRRETVVGRNFPSKWTNFTNYIGDKTPYGGFYKQSELRELVKYAASKNVDIVPEIDIPGHMTAILAAYPEYAQGKPPIETATCWGKFDNVISDTYESNKFLEGIFDEIISIFGPKYIHIGGDEVSGKYYPDESIPLNILKKTMRYLNDKGVKVVVWEEAVDAVIGTDNVVMCWKELENTYPILEKGANVVICSREYFYFDINQKESPNEPLSIGGIISVEKVSSFAIDPKFLEKYKEAIVGIQANLWTEYLATEELMDYMTYPRLEVFSKIKI